MEAISLFEKGIEIFGSEKKFQKWMNAPAFGLGEQIPSDLLRQPGGLMLILDELIRIEYGDLA